MATSCTVSVTTLADIVRSDEQESNRGFHGVDFEKDQATGAEDKNRSPETEDVRDKDSPGESTADTIRTKLKTEAVEEYDAETVIKNQQMYYLYCPCCGKDITDTVRVVRKSEIQPENRRKHVTLRFPIRIPLRIPRVFGRETDQKDKDKVDPKPVPTGVLDASNWKLKTTVLNFLSSFLNIVALLFLYIVALLFLYFFALWFLFVSPEELPSASSPHFISVFALLFVAILALWFHFNPGNNDEKDGENLTSESYGPSEVSDRSNEPSHPSRDNEPSRPLNEEGVSPSRPLSDISFANEEGKHTEPSPQQASGPDVTIEQGPAGANETEPNSLPIRPEIPVNVPRKGEILKSVVYGGLLESITSLGIVSSAAGSGASTLKIFVMGLANMSSGLSLIVHNLLELRNEKPRRTGTDNGEEDRYEQLLGRRDKFYIHAFVVISSFIVFGITPPVVYGFSFRRSDKRHYKAVAVLVVSLVCIVCLAIAKAYVSKRREYLKTVFRYTNVAIAASGVSYFVGDFVNKLLEKYGLYDDSVETPRG